MIEKLSAKDYLEKSAIELLSEKYVDDVTVKDICENCNISTRTFYKYFRDKYDIINTCFNNELSNFFLDKTRRISFHSLLCYTADIVNEQQAFFIHVFNYTGQNNIRISLVEPLKTQYLRIIREVYHDEVSKSIEDAVTFFICGQLSYVEEGLKRSVIPDAETSVAYFENAIPVILEKYL